MIICYICLRWRGEDCESVMLGGLIGGGGRDGGEGLLNGGTDDEARWVEMGFCAEGSGVLVGRLFVAKRDDGREVLADAVLLGAAVRRVC